MQIEYIARDGRIYNRVRCLPHLARFFCIMMKESKRPHRSMGIRKKLKDYIGVTVGHLTIIGAERRDRKAIAKCKCDCGKECYRELYGLILKNSKNSSCGCVTVVWNKRHGMTKTKEYAAWISMKNRCHNEKYGEYKHYGGRGISVCERWDNSFENFLLDMGFAPGDGYSIDRIDNNKNYCPENCRWATRKEQARNKQNTTTINYRGKTYPCAELEETIGCKRGRISEATKKGFDMDVYITWLFEMKKEYGHCDFVFHRKRSKQKLIKKGILK